MINQKQAKKIRNLVRSMFAAKAPEERANRYVETELNRKLSKITDPTTGIDRTMVTGGTMLLHTECERGTYRALKKEISRG